MSGVATAIGVGTLASGYMASQASGKAIGAQSDAANQANATQKYVFDTQRQDAQPWVQAGTSALSQLQDPNLGSDFQTDPGYQFRLNQGVNQINSSAAARGLGNSGATLKALDRYNQDYASNEYNNVYNRTYGRLSQLAGYGQAASAGQASAAQNYGNQVSGNQIGLGNSIASANIAQSNNMSNLLGNGMMAYASYKR